MQNELRPIEGWGRHPVMGRERQDEDWEALSAGAVLARGLGRSYGDSSLPPSGQPDVVSSVLADRILEFDPATGRLRAEAGLSLLRINRLLMPRGWFVPVTPGTQFVTLGGMVAADVHGKGHHRAGCIGEHVSRVKLRTASGDVLWCSETEHLELFLATLGGMGLTGHIVEVELTLRSIPTSWILQQTERITGIDAFVPRLREAARDWPYTVGWIDCLSQGADLGRGVLMMGRWAEPSEAPRSTPRPLRAINFPIDLPSWALSRAVVRSMNGVLYHRQSARPTLGLIHPERFFYPLDNVRNWNRLYGKRGFTQYQCVLPHGDEAGAARRLLNTLTELGCASFLCVIKDCGPQGRGLLSFPMRGISIALDIPIRDDIQLVIDRLNEQTIAEGGRIYLAKDSFTRPEHFRAMEPRLARFEAVRKEWDPETRIRSAQSVRLLGDRP